MASSGLWWAVATVIVVLVACWSADVYLEVSARDERRRADQRAATYLGLVVAGDSGKARLMLCGGDDVNPAQLDDTVRREWTGQRVTSFAISGARNWSSIDGRGTVYGVDLTFSDGVTASIDVVVTVISDEPCIGTEIPM
ncbi:hypothetical protein Pa4123_59080 [Phytohabitans aurantiacus]|uniref:Flp pilus-assembly TadG-like N-terminal domain-containing protein n=1 Tax=Phytohabitans aurantiacus TaxID=3016789 RepID=A0ABQ5R1E2_9ACTN|nr:hypothetical protein Pa4123_59080 [Phytohabitans aurantiacus]